MIVYGAFKGMGDLLNAAPVITRELDSGNTVKVLLFPGYSIEKIVDLLRSLALSLNHCLTQLSDPFG